jgi:hypothetical protein
MLDFWVIPYFFNVGSEHYKSNNFFCPSKSINHLFNMELECAKVIIFFFTKIYKSSFSLLLIVFILFFIFLLKVGI